MNPTQTKPSEKLINTAKEIQAILERENLAIEPFLRMTRNGITPDARLVEINTDHNATDTNEGSPTTEDTGTQEEGLKGVDETPSTQG